jgi:type I restriction enzyme, S subunit
MGRAQKGKDSWERPARGGGPQRRRQVFVFTEGKVTEPAIERLRLPVPPIEEQWRIVNVLGSVTELERGIEATIDKLRSVRQGALLDFISRIDPEWTAVRDLGEVRMGKQLSPDSRGTVQQFPYLRVANVHAGRIDYSDVKTMGFTKRERSLYRLIPGGYPPQ